MYSPGRKRESLSGSLTTLDDLCSEEARRLCTGILKARGRNESCIRRLAAVKILEFILSVETVQQLRGVVTSEVSKD